MYYTVSRKEIQLAVSDIHSWYLLDRFLGTNDNTFRQAKSHYIILPNNCNEFIAD